MGSCVDDIAVIRSMWTTDNDHGAQLQFHTGRHMLEGQFPTIGSWVHYGLGALSDELPSFVVIGSPIADCCGGLGGHGASYLGPEHDGIQLSVDPKNPLPFATPARDVFREEQAGEFELLGRLNGLSAGRHPFDAALRARIKSYELAFRMQTAVPEVMQLSEEPAATQRLYGLDEDVTRGFGQLCLSARRMVERGVRFVQVFHGSNGGAGAWDAHGGLRQNHATHCGRLTDRLRGCSRISNSEGCSRRRSWCGRPSLAGRLVRRERTAGITILMGFRCGWPVVESKGESFTVRRMRSVITPSSIATM